MTRNEVLAEYGVPVHNTLDFAINDLARQWKQAKQMETKAIAARRFIEDRLIAVLSIDLQSEGTINCDGDGYRIKAVTRFNQKIDSDLLQEIAAEHGLDEHLPNLFRWKPEIIAAKWKAAHHNITDKLARAVTTTPGRPSFSIEQKDA